MTSSTSTTRRPDTSRESTRNAPATFLRRALAPGRSVWATVLLRRVAVPGLARGIPRKPETTLATSVA